MKDTIDSLARQAFERMIAEAGDPRAEHVPPAFATGAEAPAMPPARTRSRAAPVLVAAAFLAVAVLPTLATRGLPRFSDRAASLPENPQLKRYAELLAGSGSLSRHR